MEKILEKLTVEEQPTSVVFDFEDAGQVLVTFWKDGSATAARRKDPWASWGPPSARTREVQR